MKLLACIIMAQLVCYGWGPASNAIAQDATDIRPPTVAGQFYPADSAMLAQAVEDYLNDAVAPRGEHVIAIVAPHAGYIYSGQIAADAFKAAADGDYDLVVILGTNHTVPGFNGVSVYARGGFRTPEGIAEIDTDLAAKLMAADDECSFQKAVHTREHSVEVQLPFVQKLFPQAKILPVVIGSPDPGLCTRFGNALADAIKDRKALIVASSDLSHYPAWNNARRVDHETLKAVSGMDLANIHATMQNQMTEGVPELVTCACGEGPILAAIVAAKKLGAHGARVISYANSGETSVGTRDRVVGYGAVAIATEKNAESLASVSQTDALPVGNGTLSDTEKSDLLHLARQSIHQYLTSETAPLARGYDSLLEKRAGAFVTLTKHGQLRGCIGHMADDLPLCQAVGYCALQAAFNDRRFLPVELDELDDIEIEISILTPYQRVGNYADIQIGRDGVMIRKNGRSAVYLPSVAVEQGWNLEQTLDQLCLKAGLSPGDWKAGTEFYTFQALVFAETDAH